MLQGGVKLYSTHTLYLFLYVAGTPVTVGVTMYILSISSVSEVMMVHKTLPLSLQLTLSLSHSLSVTVCGVCQPLSVYPAAIEKLCGGHQALEMATLLPILVGQKTYFVFPTY